MESEIIGDGWGHADEAYHDTNINSPVLIVCSLGCYCLLLSYFYHKNNMPGVFLISTLQLIEQGVIQLRVASSSIKRKGFQKAVSRSALV